MDRILWSIAVGLLVYFGMRQYSFDWLWPAWWLGIFSRSPTFALVGLLDGVGMTLYMRARFFERQRDRDESELLLFLERLQQLLYVRGTLAQALDDMGYRAIWSGSDAGERILDEVARRYRVQSMTLFSRIAFVIRRHGGALIPLVSWVIDSINDEHAHRMARRLEEEARRTTIMILIGAPLAIIAIFRLILPSFYHTLRTTELGQVALTWVALSTLGVLIVLARVTSEEAKRR